MRKNKLDLTICYAIIAILSIILAFMNYANGRIPFSIVWIANSVCNLTMGYLYYNRED